MRVPPSRLVPNLARPVSRPQAKPYASIHLVVMLDGRELEDLREEDLQPGRLLRQMEPPARGVIGYPRQGTGKPRIASACIECGSVHVTDADNGKPLSQGCLDCVGERQASLERAMPTTGCPD